MTILTILTMLTMLTILTILTILTMPTPPWSLPPPWSRQASGAPGRSGPGGSRQGGINLADWSRRSGPAVPGQPLLLEVLRLAGLRLAGGLRGFLVWP
jgi:hypothetical protein